MAERDAAIDMLAGLPGRAAQDGGGGQDKPTIFRSSQTVSSEKFLHDELRPLKEPMISTKLLGFDCGQRTRVRVFRRVANDPGSDISTTNAEHRGMRCWDRSCSACRRECHDHGQRVWRHG